MAALVGRFGGAALVADLVAALVAALGGRFGVLTLWPHWWAALVVAALVSRIGVLVSGRFSEPHWWAATGLLVSGRIGGGPQLYYEFS